MDDNYFIKRCLDFLLRNEINSYPLVSGVWEIMVPIASLLPDPNCFLHQLRVGRYATLLSNIHTISYNAYQSGPKQCKYAVTNGSALCTARQGQAHGDACLAVVYCSQQRLSSGAVNSPQVNAFSIRAHKPCIVLHFLRRIHTHCGYSAPRRQCVNPRPTGVFL